MRALLGWMAWRQPSQRGYLMAVLGFATLAAVLAYSIAAALNLPRPFMLGLSPAYIAHGALVPRVPVQRADDVLGGMTPPFESLSLMAHPPRRRTLTYSITTWVCGRGWSLSFSGRGSTDWLIGARTAVSLVLSGHQFPDQLRHGDEQIRFQPIVRHAEDRRFRFLVDRHDHL